jgi:hypothetical protein
VVVFWGWLADWSHVLTTAGLVFTLWGTGLAWQAATEDYRKHRGQPVFPQIDRAKSWFLSVIFRRCQDVVVLGSTAQAQFSASGDLTADSYRVVPEDAPLAEQVQGFTVCATVAIQRSVRIAWPFSGAISGRFEQDTEVSRQHSER